MKYNKEMDIRELMVRIKMTDEKYTSDKVLDTMSTRLEVKDGKYIWCYSTTEDASTRTPFDMCNTEISNINITTLPEYIKYIYEDNTPEGLDILKEEINKYIETIGSINIEELNFYFTQLINITLHDLGREIDNFFDVGGTISFDRFVDMIDFDLEDGRYATSKLINLQLFNIKNIIKCNPDIFISDIDDVVVERVVYDRGMLGLSIAGTSTTILYNLIFKDICRLYRIENPSMMNDCMVTLNDIFLKFHDAILSLWMIISTQYFKIYQNYENYNIFIGKWYNDDLQ